MRTVAIQPLVVSPPLIAVSLVALSATLDDSQGTTFCFFRRCTGGYCPGCGGSRATLALLRGDLAGSWALHPWVPLLALQLLAVLAIGLRYGTTRLRDLLLPALIANLVLGVGLWIARLAAGSIPIPFG